MEAGLVLLFFAFCGVLSGTLAGLIPGMGVTTVMVSIGVLFISDDPIQILVYYIGVICASQYVGSMVAITLGIPGESSSLPAVKEGYPLYKRGQGSEAIGTTAIGSFFGSFISLALFFALAPVIMNFVYLWNTVVAVVIFTLAILLTFYISPNPVLVSAMMVVIGACLGVTGRHYAINQEYFTFGLDQLLDGLPMVPVIAGIFIVPELFRAYDTVESQVKISRLSIDPRTNWSLIQQRWSVIGISSVVGFISGLVPALATKLASNFAYFVQMIREKRAKRYHKPGNLSCLVAAETSNNSASFSVLLPLLILGIPITPSEFILFNYLTSTSIGWNIDIVLENLVWLIAIWGFVNIVSLIIAWPAANVFLQLYRMPVSVIWSMLAVLVILPILYMGLRYDQLAFYIGVFVFSALIGYIVRKYDTLPAVFSFLIASEFVHSFYRLFIIYL